MVLRMAESAVVAKKQVMIVERRAGRMIRTQRRNNVRTQRWKYMVNKTGAYK